MLFSPPSLPAEWDAYYSATVYNIFGGLLGDKLSQNVPD